MKVLEIGAGHLPKAKYIPGWEEAEILTLDADKQHKPDILADAGEIPEEWYGKFDGVLASHVLEHFGYWESVAILEHWGQALKEEGELHIIVPSLEWVGRAVLSEQLPMSVFPHLFGGHETEWNGHKSMFTMRLLRNYVERAGFGTVAARTGLYAIMVTDEHGKEHKMQAEEHYVKAIKIAVA